MLEINGFTDEDELIFYSILSKLYSVHNSKTDTLAFVDIDTWFGDGIQDWFFRLLDRGFIEIITTTIYKNEVRITIKFFEIKDLGIEYFKKLEKKSSKSKIAKFTNKLKSVKLGVPGVVEFTFDSDNK